MPVDPNSPTQAPLDTEATDSKLSLFKDPIGYFQDVSVQEQLVVMVGVLALSWLATKITKKRFHASAERPDSSDFIKKAWLLAESLIGPIYLLTLCLLTVVVYPKFQHYRLAPDLPDPKLDHDVVRAITSVASAWAVTRFLSVLIKGRAWIRLIAVIVFTVAILSVSNLLQPTVKVLNGLKFPVGEKPISALNLLNGIGILLGLLWGTSVLSRIVEKRVKVLPNVPPSLQVLLAKLVRMALIFFSILVALTTVGLDLSSFAILGGAIGVGIGFGLQKVVSNLVSGLVLLLDRSIKPGDVIEIDQTYGWINSLRARYASVITRDGKEHLIPNEDLITNKVINWSFSHKNVRVRVPIGISYNADPREAIELCLDAAKAEPRVISDPEPRCLLRGFGENSIELELRFWIADPSNGVGNMRSAVLLGIWDRFKEAGISIPYPQRDIHLRSASPDLLQSNPLQEKTASVAIKDPPSVKPKTEDEKKPMDTNG